MEVAGLIFGIIPIATKIAKTAYEYGEAVRTAEADHDRLKEVVESIINVLKYVEKLSKEQKQLPAPQELLSALASCQSEFKTLAKRLAIGKTTKWKRLGGRALKWPFQNQEVNRIITDLERRKQTICMALQEYQTALTVGLHGKLDRADLDRVLDRLPQAKGARFDSYDDEHLEGCLANTRVELLQQITDWIEDPQSKSIFWLDGMAGTGKSTISRSVAQSLAKDGQLGASFFFKRGEAERSNTEKFFTSIAAQLADKIPEFAQRVKIALEKDRGICGTRMSEQFKHLILRPLEQKPDILIGLFRLVIVIDALDECVQEENIQVILLLLSQIHKATSTPVRIFVTSRPEPPIRLTFHEIGDLHQNFVLHNVPQAIVGNDIALYLNHELKKIQQRKSLPETWPDPDDVKALVEMAIPLFIFAATVVRFVDDRKWSPEQQLKVILEARSAAQESKYDRSYFPVLEQLVADQSKKERDTIQQGFLKVMGAIVVLADPLSINALATILNMDKQEIENRLDLLHSVINIPKLSSSPVRLFHLSFRDFLVDEEKRAKKYWFWTDEQKAQKYWFWIDERKAHEALCDNCLELLSRELKENICNFKSVGASRHDIDIKERDKYLPAEVQYSARYWVFHLEQSQPWLTDGSSVEIFLREHLLHWLEVLSILGLYTEGITMIQTLISLSIPCPKLHAFVVDMERFVLNCRTTVDLVPLQIYSSALIFTPINSLVRKQFVKLIPVWVRISQLPQKSWSWVLQVLEGLEPSTDILEFSPDGTMLAASSIMGNLGTLWDTVTGTMLQSYKGIYSGFSPDNKRLVLINNDLDIRSISLLDIASGTIQHRVVLMDTTIKENQQWIFAKFTPDSSVVAYTYQQSDPHVARKKPVFPVDGNDPDDKAVSYHIQLWRVSTRQRLSLITYTLGQPCFSPNSLKLAAGIAAGKVLIYDASTGAVQRTLEIGEDDIRDMDIAFSPDGSQLAVALTGQPNRFSAMRALIQLWNWEKGELVYQTEYPNSGAIESLKCLYVNNGRRLVSWILGYAARPKLLDIVSNPYTWLSCNFPGYHNPKHLTNVQSTNDRLFTWYEKRRCDQWDTATGKHLRQYDFVELNSSAVSSDGERMALSSKDDRSIQIVNNTMAQTVPASKEARNISLFAPDLTLQVTWTQTNAEDAFTVSLRDTMTGDVRQKLEATSCNGWNSTGQVKFSNRGQQIAVLSTDSTITVWNTVNGTQQKFHRPDSAIFIKDFWFVQDDRHLAVASPLSEHSSCLFLWDIATGVLVKKLTYHLWYIFNETTEFSSDGNYLATSIIDVPTNGNFGYLYRIMENETLHLMYSFSVSLPVSMKFTHDSKRFAVADEIGLSYRDVGGVGASKKFWKTEDSRCSGFVFLAGDTLVARLANKPSYCLFITDVKTGNTLQRIELGSNSRLLPRDQKDLVLSADGSCLQYGLGVVQLHNVQRSTSKANTPQMEFTLGLHIDCPWVCRGNDKLFCLPHPYRAENFEYCKAAYQDGIVTFLLRLQSGEVLRLDFDA